MKTFKEINETINNTKILTAQQMSVQEKNIFKKLLDGVDDHGEYNLPKEIQSMDKEKLLKLVYRLVKMIK